MKTKAITGILLTLFLASMLGMVIPAQANNSVDTSGVPSHWAIITLYDESESPYGFLWLIGWYTTEPYEPGPDGTINHVIWEVHSSDMPKVLVGDNLFSVHGWYEDGRIKWIHNAKDFNIHLETDFSTTGGYSASYGGLIKYVEGKTYGTSVHGSIEWHWSWVGTPPFIKTLPLVPFRRPVGYPFTQDVQKSRVCFIGRTGNVEVRIEITGVIPNEPYEVALEYNYGMSGWTYYWIGTFTTDGYGNGVFKTFYTLSSGTHYLGVDVVDWEPEIRGNYYAEFVSSPLAYLVEIF